MKFLKFLTVFVLTGIVHYGLVVYLLEKSMGKTMYQLDNSMAIIEPTGIDKLAKILISVLLFPGSFLVSTGVVSSELGGPISTIFYASFAVAVFGILTKRK